jgi:hypothetical protein
MTKKFTATQNLTRKIMQIFWDKHQQDRAYWHRYALAAALKELVSSEETTYCGDDWVETPHCIPSYIIEDVIKELEQDEKDSCV